MTQNSASGLAGAPSTDAALLELNGVSVHYGAVVALDDVSLGIRKGEVVAVMGPNGAGKSTVLKAIMGLAPVVAGEVHWRQQRLAAATHEIVKEGIAFVPQGRRVFTHLTIEENLELGCLYLADGAEKARRLDAVMELFPILREKRRDMASQMSGGQQQMLALGRGLMAGPEVLLLDEPTLGLAPIIVSEVFQKVREISDLLSTTIMLVEHNIRGALEIVDRAYVLDMGRVVHDGTPESIRETNILTDVFLGRVRRDDEEPRAARSAPAWFRVSPRPPPRTRRRAASTTLRPRRSSGSALPERRLARWTARHHERPVVPARTRYGRSS